MSLNVGDGGKTVESSGIGAMFEDVDTSVDEDSDQSIGTMSMEN